MSMSTEQVASQTCPVCKGEKRLRGYQVPDDSFTIYPGEKQVTIICDECGGAGKVPVEGDLAAWQEKAQDILRELASILLDADAPLHVAVLLEVIRLHLAAMPQAQPDAELLKALKGCREAFRLTREYIGEDKLPAIKGWSWFDADIEAAAAIAKAKKGEAK